MMRAGGINGNTNGNTPKSGIDRDRKQIIDCATNVAAVQGNTTLEDRRSW